LITCIVHWEINADISVKIIQGGCILGWVDIGTGAKGRWRKVDPYKLKILKLVSYLFMASCQNH